VPTNRLDPNKTTDYKFGGGKNNVYVDYTVDNVTYNSFTDTNDYTVKGGGGDDTIVTAAGNDVIYGQGGSDWLMGAAGNDLIYGNDDAPDAPSRKGSTDRLFGDLADQNSSFDDFGDDTLYGASGSTNYTNWM
jgi:Ca2+-binding RTX toxin-like protein